MPLPQTLKERFAELLPEKIEQIKTLRKYVTYPHPLSETSKLCLDISD